MTPTMSSQAAITSEARKKEFVWTVEMPKDIMEMFGLPEERPVTFHAQPGNISATLDLTGQTVEAGNRGPGWFVPLLSNAAAASGFSEGSFIGIWAKLGTARVEIIPPPSPEFNARIQQIIEQYGDDFEEMKRLGD